MSAYTYTLFEHYYGAYAPILTLSAGAEKGSTRCASKRLTKGLRPINAKKHMEDRTVEVRNGLKFKFSCPANEKEYHDAAKRGDRAMLDDALDNNIYRTGLPDAWSQLAEALERVHFTKKNTKPHPDPKRAAKGDTVIAETNPAYVDRVIAERQLKLIDVQAVVDTFGVLPLDLTERRGQGGALVGKQDLELAAGFLDSGDEKLDRALSRIAEMTGEPKVELTGDRDSDQRAIALAIKAYKAAMAKQLV